MPPHIANFLLRWLLRLIGGVELLATPFIFFPIPLMDAIHNRVLGLGSLPPGPIVEYMARSLSALYAVHGALVFRLSFDLPRFRPVIGFLGWLHLVFGVTVLGIDRVTGLPFYWTIAEGPGITMGGVVILILNRAGERIAPKRAHE